MFFRKKKEVRNHDELVIPRDAEEFAAKLEAWTADSKLSFAECIAGALMHSATFGSKVSFIEKHAEATGTAPMWFRLWAFEDVSPAIGMRPVIIQHLAAGFRKALTEQTELEKRANAFFSELNMAIQAPEAGTVTGVGGITEPEVDQGRPGDPSK